MRRALATVSIVAASLALTFGCDSILGIEDAYLVPKADGGDGAAVDDVVACGDVVSDPKNCGRCGHDCLGGACVDARCQPSVVATGQVTPRAVATDGTSVFWASEQRILRAPISGGAPAELASIGFFATHIVPVSGAVFAGGAGMIVRAREDGGVTTLAASDAGAPALVPMAADSTSLFFWEAPGIKRQGFTQAQATMLVSAPDCRDLALDGTHVLWTTASSISRVDKSSADAGAGLLLAASDPTRIAVGGNYLYFLEGAQGLLKRSFIGGGEAVTIGGCSPGVSLAADEAFVYCAQARGIVRFSAVSGQEEVTLTTTATPTSIAIDGPSVFFTLEGSGDVLRVAK